MTTSWFLDRLFKATRNKFCVLCQEIQCSQKVSFRPETGPEFPQIKKNPKIFGTSLGINLAGKYEKQLLKFLFVFCQVMEKGTSELTKNAEFISGGLIAIALLLCKS